MRWLVDFAQGIASGFAGSSHPRTRATCAPRASAKKDSIVSVLGGSLVLCLAAAIIAGILSSRDSRAQKGAPMADAPHLPVALPQNFEELLAWDPRATPRVWSYIVIHHSASNSGSAQSFDMTHRIERGWQNGLGYHFVVGNGHGQADGHIAAGPRWFEQRAGAHANAQTFNEHGIGICLVGNFDLQPPTEAQLSAAKKLIVALCQKFQIPRHNILGHNQVRRGGSTACPGKLLNLDELRTEN